MPYLTAGTLHAFQFESLRLPGVGHAIFTRQGGVSLEPWRSLNVGGSVGDRPDNVATNRKLIFEAVDRPADSLATVWQTHSDRVVVVNRPMNGADPEKADAMVTDRPEVTLMLRFADCVPILAYDPARHALGIAHAGWKGTLSGIARQLIASFGREYGSHPQDLCVGIGPSVAAHHYPVGPEVVEAVRMAFGEIAGQTKFDLWAANRWLLEAAGVTHIEMSGVCTACETGDWYSHRAEAGRTGRFGAVLYLTG
jgi:YfiH family protein